MLHDIGSKVNKPCVCGDSICPVEHSYHDCCEEGLGVVLVHGCNQPDLRVLENQFAESLGSHDRVFILGQKASTLSILDSGYCLVPF